MNTSRLAPLFTALRALSPEDADLIVGYKNRVEDPLYLEARQAAYAAAKGERELVEDVAHQATQALAEALATKQGLTRRADPREWQDTVYNTFKVIQPVVKDATFAVVLADELHPAFLRRLMSPLLRFDGALFGSMVPRVNEGGRS